jgi:hypothetical protein
MDPLWRCSAKGRALGGENLLDLVFLLTGLAFFALMAIYASACDRL